MHIRRRILTTVRQKNYESDLSELSIVSQFPAKEPFLPVKRRFAYEQAKDNYGESSERTEKRKQSRHLGEGNEDNNR